MIMKSIEFRCNHDLGHYEIQVRGRKRTIPTNRSDSQKGGPGLREHEPSISTSRSEKGQ